MDERLDLKFDTFIQQLSVAASPGDSFAPAIERSVVTRASDIVALAAKFRSGHDHFYNRFGNNPTIAHVESLLARLDRMERSLLFPSGMAAISAVLLSTLAQGVRHALVQDQLFDQTAKLFNLIDQWGLMQVQFIAANQIPSRLATTGAEPVLVYLESPSNPLLEIADVAFTTAAAKDRNPGNLIAVDSTVGPPGVQQLADLGVDFVIHSATKFLGGHNDLMAGVVSTRRSQLESLHAIRLLFGAIPNVDEAWLLSRSLKTHAIRIGRICDSAERIANHLQRHSAVAEVWYPYVGDPRKVAVARRQMARGGGLVSFALHGGSVAARSFCDALKTVQLATSLGGTATVIEIPGELDWSGEQQAPANGPRKPPEGLIRLSVGLEDADDLVADLDQALADISRTRVATPDALA